MGFSKIKQCTHFYIIENAKKIRMTIIRVIILKNLNSHPNQHRPMVHQLEAIGNLLCSVKFLMFSSIERVIVNK